MSGRVRHDEVSSERQQKLSVLLLVANLVIAAVSVAFAIRYDWHPGLTSLEVTVLASLFAATAVALLLAAGTVEWLGRCLSALAQSPPSKPNAAGFLARRRMVFFYAGVWLNLLALAAAVELTGGLAESPYVAIFVAFVLTGQQLSRFRTQSGFLIATGFGLALAMILLREPIAGEVHATPPHELEIALVVLALAAGGTLTFWEKPRNYLLSKHVRAPSHARVYTDGRGDWHYSLYEHTHRVDPVILGQHDGSARTTDGAFPDGLKEKLEEVLAVMASEADWAKPRPEWPEACALNFTVDLGLEPADRR